MECFLLQRHWCQSPKYPPKHLHKHPLRTTLTQKKSSDKDVNKTKVSHQRECNINTKNNQKNKTDLQPDFMGILKNTTGKTSKRFKQVNKIPAEKHSTTKYRRLKIMYANANRITGKMGSLQTATRTHNSHIITITETKVQGGMLKLEGYEWISMNRTGTEGGVDQKCNLRRRPLGRRPSVI